MVDIRPIEPADHAAVERIQLEMWGSPICVAHGEVFRPGDLPGFLAEDAGKIVGMLTYQQQDPTTIEVVTLDAVWRHAGIGTALLDAAAKVATSAGATRLILTTTNDNVDALRFYQRRGFRLIALRPGALDETRKLKPEVPSTGNYGIPLSDELELERPIRPTTADE
jgi:ribosomal protein S18 acetylase RimI-like enzyme